MFFSGSVAAYAKPPDSHSSFLKKIFYSCTSFGNSDVPNWLQFLKQILVSLVHTSQVEG
jgi:hypothetical protein